VFKKNEISCIALNSKRDFQKPSFLPSGCAGSRVISREIAPQNAMTRSFALTSSQSDGLKGE
ncbi:hypothetical protein, partial [Rhizobium tibeticum]|uniref:hypothetical protein n=1 Tax=Rhizobium tibeticum TaxID=501024 RepID=UPI001ABF93A7